MSVPHGVDPTNIEALRQVLVDVRDTLQGLDLDACDTADMEELLDRIAAELDVRQPSVATLSTYLNSVARSLRSEPRARTVVMELDAAMRDAQLPRGWEH